MTRSESTLETRGATGAAAGPLVTIGISTYRRGDSPLLREALSSATAQTWPHLEILVSDNASGDATGDVVRSLADDRTRYVEQPENLGANGNFNWLAENARGEYFLLLHDDDRIDPGMVEACMRAIGDERPGLVRTGTRVIDGESRTLSERRNLAPDHGGVEAWLRAWFRSRTSLYLCSTLFRTDALLEVGGFASRHELYQDVVAEVRVAARHGRAEVPEVLASFRRHDGNAGGAALIRAWCEDSHEVLREIRAAAPHDDALMREARVWLSGNNYSRAERLASLVSRWRAYLIVWRAFGFVRSPLRYLTYKRLLRTKRRVLSHGRGV